MHNIILYFYSKCNKGARVEPVRLFLYNLCFASLKFVLGAEPVNCRIEFIGGDIVIVVALPFSVVERLATHNVYETLGIDDPYLTAQNVHAFANESYIVFAHTYPSISPTNSIGFTNLILSLLYFSNLLSVELR